MEGKQKKNEQGGRRVGVEAVELEGQRGLHPVPGQPGGHPEAEDGQALRAPGAALPRRSSDVPGAGAAWPGQSTGSRSGGHKIWYGNVPHTKLVAYKGHQNWVK